MFLTSIVVKGPNPAPDGIIHLASDVIISFSRLTSPLYHLVDSLKIIHDPDEAETQFRPTFSVPLFKSMTVTVVYPWRGYEGEVTNLLVKDRTGTRIIGAVEFRRGHTGDPISEQDIADALIKAMEIAFDHRLGDLEDALLAANNVASIARDQADPDVQFIPREGIQLRLPGTEASGPATEAPAHPDGADSPMTAAPAGDLETAE